MPFVRRWAVLIAVCVVALLQLAQVLARRQSSWKGGGFGMYAGFHPNLAEIWAWPPDGSPPVRFTRSAQGPENTSAGLRLCTVRTTAACLEDRVPRDGDAPRYERLELWERSFDLDTRRLSRRLIATFPESARP